MNKEGITLPSYLRASNPSFYTIQCPFSPINQYLKCEVSFLYQRKKISLPPERIIEMLPYIDGARKVKEVGDWVLRSLSGVKTCERTAPLGLTQNSNRTDTVSSRRAAEGGKA
jgi:hypothetical protein